MTVAGDLFQAIKTVWDADSTLSAIHGPYREEEAIKASPVFPYCVCRTPTSHHEQTTNASEYWRHTVEFVVYAATMEAIDEPGGYLDLIGNAFDPTLPTLASGKGRVILTRRMVEEYGEEERLVYRGIITYEFLRQKPRITS